MTIDVSGAPGHWCLPVYDWDAWEGDLLVIVACSGKKLDHPAPAAELYQGSFFQLALSAARTLVPDDQIRVLSALSGFVRLDRVIAPYERRICHEGKLGPAHLRDMADPAPLPHVLRAQAEEQGIADLPSVLSLCPHDYWRCVQRTWGIHRAVDAFYGCRGIGDMRHVLSRICKMEQQEYVP